ncbi:MAG TPA: alpha/beta hydrolase-fold protein [Candidatus Acidoferrales bacterium]|nr:alpha/beta hydrolase-fold protein [Candidatus Acidoferrales bacterium]
MNSCGRAALRISLALSCLAFARPATAALGRFECRAIHSKILSREVRYCALLPPSYDTAKARRFPVLYFLHGLGGDEQLLVNSGGWNLVEDLWQEDRIREFLIVTPDGDTSFYINSRDGHQRYEDFFFREFLPFIERDYRIKPGRRFRGIGGVSMGGYGALHLAFLHPEFFGSVSSNSAALLEHLPDVKFASPRGSSLLRVLSAFGSPPDPEFWKRNSPSTLARTAHLAGLKIYFDCGSEDDYGFEKGAQAFHKLLDSLHIPHEFHLYPGGHDAMYFAQHMPAAFEFHSRAFAMGIPEK